jgi:hypothetical protein
MITLNELISNYKDHTKDDSAENTQRGIRRINELQKMLCASENYWWLETTYSVATVASQATYDLPVDFRKMKEVRTTYGGTSGRQWVVQEMVNPTEFDKMFFLTTNQFAIAPTYYHVRGNQLLLFPKTSNSTETIYMLYIKRPINMEIIDYDAGSVLTLTTGTKAVTGTGTLWATNARAGSYIIINDYPYQIASVGSDTALTLSNIYQGASISVATPYKLADIPIIPEDFADILWVGAARDYYLKRNDTEAYKLYTDRYVELETRLKQNTKSKSVENVIELKRLYNINPNFYPTMSAAP